MEPTIQNRDFLFNGSPTLVNPFISKLIVKLRSPNTSDEFCLAYFTTMKSHWERESIRRQGLGWTRVQQKLFDSGIIETILVYTQGPSNTQDRDAAGMHALDSIQHFILGGTSSERRKLFSELMKHNFVFVCIDKIDNSPFISHRGAAANCLHLCINRCPLPESLSAERTAQALEKFAQWTLLGTDRDAEELTHLDKIWQTQLFSGRLMMPQMASKYARRISAMKAEHYIFASHGLLCRIPLPSRKFVLDVVTHRPNIFDLFFNCGLMPRQPWYPESDVDSAAMEILALLLQFPLTTIPHIEIPLEGRYKDEYQEDLNTSIEIIKTFMSRPGWSQKLIDAWTKYEEESVSSVEGLLSRVSQDWYSAAPPEDDAILEAMERRGTIRIATLRLIANATYTNDIKDSDLLSLVRIAYLACHKIKSQEEVLAGDNPDDLFIWQERNQEILRVPLSGLDVNVDTADEIASIPREATMGPIALVRVLTRLAERGLLDQSQTWTELPEGVSPDVSLDNLKQITSPPILRKVLSVTLKRVTAYRDVGKERAQRAEHRRALLAFVPAAELASCLLEFNVVTTGKYSEAIRGARKELVLCLGNAAEMAKRKSMHGDALRLAAAAVHYANNAIQDEGITSDLVAKNERRLAEAKRVLNIA